MTHSAGYSIGPGQVGRRPNGWQRGRFPLRPRFVPLALLPALLSSCALRSQPPSAAPEIVAAGVISTEKGETPGSFTLARDELYFDRVLNHLDHWTIASARMEQGSWSRAETAPFVDPRYSDRDPFLSPDGRRLFFSSDRPAPGKNDRSYDLWTVERRADGSWGVPARLPEPINTITHEGTPVVTRDGTLYFKSGRPGAYGRIDLYRARPVEGGYAAPENVGPLINTRTTGAAFVTPDERVMLLLLRDPKDGRRVSLAVSANRNGAWTRPRVLTSGLAAHTDALVVSPDGRHLYFASQETGSGDLYRIDLRGLGLDRSIRRSLRAP
jgi:hypothetical protein